MQIRIMLNCVIVFLVGQLEVNPEEANTTDVATVVQILSDNSYDYAKVYIVYGYEGDEAIAQVLKHSHMAATAYDQGKIDFGIITPQVVQISTDSEAAEIKKHDYPVIITA